MKFFLSKLEPLSTRICGLGLFFCLLLQTPGYSQSPNPLSGKNIGVYFSKKYFSYDEEIYLKLLGQFVSASQTDTSLVAKDLKLASLVQLGHFFTSQLPSAGQADSVYFLNENPILAGEFLEKYEGDQNTLEPLGAPFLATDWILVIKPLTLGGYKSTAVFSRSNRIYTETLLRKTARVKMDLFNPRTGVLQYSVESCLDELDLGKSPMVFDFSNANSPTGKFLAGLFSNGVASLKSGQPGNCAH